MAPVLYISCNPDLIQAESQCVVKGITVRRHFDPRVILRVVFRRFRFLWHGVFLLSHFSIFRIRTGESIPDIGVEIKGNKIVFLFGFCFLDSVLFCDGDVFSVAFQDNRSHLVCPEDLCTIGAQAPVEPALDPFRVGTGLRFCC